MKAKQWAYREQRNVRCLSVSILCPAFAIRIFDFSETVSRIAVKIGCEGIVRQCVSLVRLWCNLQIFSCSKEDFSALEVMKTFPKQACQKVCNIIQLIL